jgi:hypothetical protein
MVGFPFRLNVGMNNENIGVKNRSNPAMKAHLLAVMHNGSETRQNIHES